MTNILQTARASTECQHVLTRNNRDVVVNFEPGINMRKMIFQSVIQTARKNESEYSPIEVETYDLLATSPDTVPLSYRRLMEAEDTTLGSYDKHPANCYDYRL